MKKFLMLSLIFIGLMVVSLGAVDVSGEWEMSSQTPRGDDMTRTITITQEGEKITVTMPGRQGQELTGEGTIIGNKIEWTISRSTPRGDFTMQYRGTVAGDTMSGEVEVGDRGAMEWTAKKL